MEGQKQMEEGLQSGRPGLELDMAIQLKKKSMKILRLKIAEI